MVFGRFDKLERDVRRADMLLRTFLDFFENFDSFDLSERLPMLGSLADLSIKAERSVRS